MSTTPIWLEDPYEPRPPLEGDVTAEACVIGAGIGGLAAAWHLLDRGIRPVVLEARAVASGASGRNGGFFIAGAAPMYHRTIALWGAERARRIHAATVSAKAEILALAEEIEAREHFRIAGMLRLAVDAAEAQDVRDHHAALAADGFGGELVAATALPEALRGRGRIGLFLAADGSVHPVRWLRALAAACAARGARVHEGTPVVGVPAGGVVRTASATVRTGAVVVAMDAGLAALVPAARAVRPRRLNMLATAPEPARRLPFPVYARDGHEYAQQLPDGRVVLGGFSDLDGPDGWTDREAPSERVQARLEAYLREELGVAAPVASRWAGVVGYAEDPMPRCGPAAPGTYALGGYNGTGQVQAYVAARIVADLIAGGSSPDDGLYAAVAAG